ncbi:unnamed protein product [Rotaria magnacalcarata]|uniref:Uncharacterized protein n=1 Tax=Rotaria magnacalcarata TaxID=392030 RepID=A0A816F0Y2_9BILA|nr:unnamed protein product [Rotaria magnacalcarata]CAF4478249.1 unnamed protein product [Rotaria magnacalcarata]CAF4511184.1 unnamed protein product [Rotaria magnacalcarata]
MEILTGTSNFSPFDRLAHRETRNEPMGTSMRQFEAIATPARKRNQLDNEIENSLLDQFNKLRKSFSSTEKLTNRLIRAETRNAPLTINPPTQLPVVDHEIEDGITMDNRFELVKKAMIAAFFELNPTDFDTFWITSGRSHLAIQKRAAKSRRKKSRSSTIQTDINRVTTTELSQKE